MDELFTIFLIVVFVLLPMLEGVVKKRRGEGDGPPIDPGPPEEPRRSPAEARRTPSGGARTSEGMIPPDVWEELTGQPAPHRSPSEGASEPRPAPKPATAAEREHAPGSPPTPGGTDRATPEALPGEVRTGSLAVAREEIGGARGGEVGRGPGVMKRRPVPAMGSGAYHGRGKGAAPAAHLVAGLRAGASIEELRRAVLYREVLGPPVSLRERGRGGDRPE